MSYADATDMEARFGDGEMDQLGSASDIAQALADADAVIDAHLAGRYALPLDSVPPILKGYACDLARERLYKDDAPEIVVKRGDDARRFLREVAQGRILLGVQPQPATAGGIAWSAPARVMTSGMEMP